MRPGRRGTQPDYVLVGHLTRDRFDAGVIRPGGTARYAGLAAARLGRRVGLLTAWPSGEPLPPELREIEVTTVPTDELPAFAHPAPGQARGLRLLSQGPELSPRKLPEAWRSAALFHLAPVYREVPLHFIDRLPPGRVMVTAQGWTRDCDAEGWLKPAPEPIAAELGRVGALVISEEDIQGRGEGSSAAREWARRVARSDPVVALTLGARGCVLFERAGEVEIPPWPVPEVDSVGAGDVFAAAFFVRLSATHDAEQSARFASCAAALFVAGDDVTTLPSREEVLRALGS